MTKKDYITIANALKPFYNSPSVAYQVGMTEIPQSTLVIEIITAISKALKADNPKFNPVKFLDYLRN